MIAHAASIFSLDSSPRQLGCEANKHQEKGTAADQPFLGCLGLCPNCSVQVVWGSGSPQSFFVLQGSTKVSWPRHHNFSGEKQIISSFHTTFSGTFCTCDKGERVCCLILTLAEGTGGNFLFFVGLNLPIKSTPLNLAYSADFTGSTETQDLCIPRHLSDRMV